MNNNVRIRIWISEDEDGVRSVVKKILSNFFPHAEISDFGNGEKAYLAFQHIPSGLRPRVLITDFQMPKLDGIELARRFKEADPDIGVLLMSGAMFGEPAAKKRRAVEDKVVDLLLDKPFTPDELRNRVEALILKRKQKEAANT